MDSVILRTERLGVSLSGTTILKNISFEINKGEHWLVTGKAGSGKTVLAYALSGQSGHTGIVEWPLDRGNYPVVVVDHQHRFRDLNNQSQFYYQQRYQASDAGNTKTVRQDLHDKAIGGSDIFNVAAWTSNFGLGNLLDRPLIQLSNGENKRLQILKAVLQKPILLILDEPYAGLDASGRQILDSIFKFLTSSGIHLMLLTSRNHIPEVFNRFALLQDGQLNMVTDPGEIRSAEIFKMEQSVLPLPSADIFIYPPFDYAIRMRNIQVKYGEQNVLLGINWDVKKGECWALTGANGAGKSTLLSLLTGDNPQAYANEIYLFDRRRGSGESIWEIKEKIGFLSPELHLYFDPTATVFSALASGLFDTLGLFRRLSMVQEEWVQQWLIFLNCSGFAERRLNTLPAGLQRLILLGRALIKLPPLLILDEPCQGLDAAQTAFTLGIIDQYCRKYEASLIFVSHYSTDFPACITHRLTIHKGRIA